MSRPRLVLAHFGVDLATIPVLCLSLWAGTCLGTWLVGPIQPEKVDLSCRRRCCCSVAARKAGGAQRERLHVDPAAFGPSLWAVGGLLFAISGYTMALSAFGRSRWRVLGLAVFLTLVQFLINVVGQLWDVLEPFRPWTIFYYYQPQDIIRARRGRRRCRHWPCCTASGRRAMSWRWRRSRGGTCRRRCRK